MEKNIQTGKRIQIRREELRMNLGDVAKEVGVAVSTIQRYEKGKIEKIKLPVIEAIAKALRVNPAWLLGETDQMQLPDPATIDNLIPLPKTYQIPLLGDIACGSPILAEENVEAILEVPVHIKADFALRCHGDSMTGAHIHDGDIVYIRQQPDVTTVLSPRSASKIRPPSSGCTSIRTSWSSPRITRSTSRLSTPARSFPRCASLEKRWASPAFLIKRKKTSVLHG